MIPDRGSLYTRMRTRLAHQPTGIVGVLFVLVAFELVAGLTGALMGAIVAVAWYLLPSPYAVAIGMVGFAALLPSPPAPITVIVGAGGFLLILIDPGRHTDHVFPFVASLLVVAVLFGGSAGMVGLWLEPWIVGLLVIGLLGMVAYTLHRYERVVLGIGEG